MTVSPIPDGTSHDGSGFTPLTKIWQAWKRLGQFLADVTARVVLTLFYFTLFLPFGIYVTLTRDPLHMRQEVASPTWTTRHPDDGLLDDARRQF